MAFAVMAKTETITEADSNKCEKIVRTDIYQRPNQSVKKSCKRACEKEKLYFVRSVEPRLVASAYNPLRGDHIITDCCCSSKRWGLF